MSRPPKMKHPDLFAHELRIHAAMGAYTPEERRAREAKYRALWEQWHPSRERLEEIVFACRMKSRQGTFAQDFNALYTRKAELDRQLLGQPPDDRRP